MLIEKAETRLVEEEDAMALLEKVVTPEQARELARLREEQHEANLETRDKFTGAHYEKYKS